MDKAVPMPGSSIGSAALITAPRRGTHRRIGISNVSLDHLVRAMEVTEIVCVQNYFNLGAATQTIWRVQRTGIAFALLLPLGFPRAQREIDHDNQLVNDVAAAHDATPSRSPSRGCWPSRRTSY